MRLRGQPGITEPSAYGTVTGPGEGGFEIKQKNRRRNHYQTRAGHCRLASATSSVVIAVFPGRITVPGCGWNFVSSPNLP